MTYTPTVVVGPQLEDVIPDRSLVGTIRAMLFGAIKSGDNALAQIIAKQIQRAKLGDTKAAAFLMDRAYGMPKATVENTGTVTNKIIIEVVNAKEK